MNNSVNAIRFLSMDMINKANSGHPGIALGAAPMLYTLYTRHLRMNNKKVDWFNRDRFILAAGHGSSMLYAALHLGNFGLSIDDLKDFRQLGSKTPGHPEYGHTAGIDATSGPLGQGIAMGVGMQLAENYLAAKFNKDIKVVDHYTYVLCGDGDLQEGVTQEAFSYAGHNQIDKLIVLYDSNDIQLDGSVSMCNSEDVKAKYESMNWNYLLVKDGNDVEEIDAAIIKAKELSGPTIIEVKTIIGFGASNEGDSATHGAPLGIEETDKIKDKFGYSKDLFSVSDDVYEDFKVNCNERGLDAYSHWIIELQKYEKEYPELYKEFMDIVDNKVVFDDDVFSSLEFGNEASRVSGGNVLNCLSKASSAVIGGSADLTKSTKAKGLDGDFSREHKVGRNVNFGVREHAMGAMVNGMTLHHLKAFSGGFFVFADYLKPSMRMASLMDIPSVFIFTHDSVAVGEDGPTHEPIEQLTMLRSLPNMDVLRPCNGVETMHAYKYAFNKINTPSTIVLTRQNLEVKHTPTYDEFLKGAYVVKSSPSASAVLLASGSEVNLCLEAAALLEAEDIYVNVVSMPSQELFDQQSREYQESVLPRAFEVFAVEMGHPMSCYKYADAVYGIESFGVSAPGNEAIDHFGFNAENIKNSFQSYLDEVYNELSEVLDMMSDIDEETNS